MKRVHPVLVAVLGYGVLLILFFFPFFFQNKTFLPTDLFLMLYEPYASTYAPFLPHNHFESDIFKFHYFYQWGAKHFLYQPYWVPEIFGGIPQYANTYASHFSTLNWVMAFGPLEWVYPLKLVLFLWIAATNMFLFVRSLGASNKSSLLSGLCFGFSSMFFTMLLRWWIPGAYAWFPLVLLFAYRFHQKKDISDFCWTAVFLAFSFLDGFFQSSASIVIALVAYWLTLVVSRSGFKFKPISISLLQGVGLVALAVLLSAIMWFPQLEYFYYDLAKGGSRAAGIYFNKNIFERILSFFALSAAAFPQILGTPQLLDLSKLAKTHLQDFALFIGTGPLILVLAAFKKDFLKEDYKKAFAGLMGLGIFIPIFTPLDRFLYFRFFAVYIVGATALLPFAFDYFLQNQGLRKGVEKVSLLLGSVLSFLGILFFLIRLARELNPGKIENLISQVLKARLDQSTFAMIYPDWFVSRGIKFLDAWSLKSIDLLLPWFFCLLSCVLVYFWAKNKFTNKTFVNLLLLLTGVQLFHFGRQWHGFHDLNQYPIFPKNDLTRFFEEHDPHQEYRVATIHQTIRGKKPKIIAPTSSNFFMGFSMLEGFDGVRPKTIYDLSQDEYDFKTLGRLNVKYIVSNGPLSEVKNHLELKQDGHLKIYENKLTQPRGLVLDGKDQRIISSDVKILKSSNNFIHYEVNAPTEGLFQTSETFYPGWKATVNGLAVAIQKSDQALRSLPIPSGKSRVEFHFRPFSYELGKITSLASAVVVFLVMMFSFFHKRKTKYDA